MPGHDIIVIGTSAGGVEALQILVGGLPCDLAAAIFIVLHLAPTGPSFLDEILTRAGPPSRPLRKEVPVSKKLAIETRIVRGDHGLDAGILALGPLSPSTYPECHGVLVQLQDGDFTRFRCHTGHAYSLSSFLAEVTQSVVNSLWSTLRTMEESILLLQHLAHHARDHQDSQIAKVAERKARDAEQSSQVIRDLLRRQEILVLSRDRVGPAQSRRRAWPGSHKSGRSAATALQAD